MQKNRTSNDQAAMVTLLMLLLCVLSALLTGCSSGFRVEFGASPVTAINNQATFSSRELQEAEYQESKTSPRRY